MDKSRQFVDLFEYVSDWNWLGDFAAIKMGDEGSLFLVQSYGKTLKIPLESFNVLAEKCS